MNLTRTLLCSMVIGCVSAPALAALGEDASSVAADRASLKGELHVTPRVDYALHEILTPGGLVVHEYVSPQGRVFAVSWRGPAIPDLRQLLGSFYEQFAQAASQPHGYNHHHLSVATPDVVVQSSGHTRAFFGRAWAPALLPADFSPNAIN